MSATYTFTFNRTHTATFAADAMRNVLRDLLSAPWLQIRGQFPDDGEAHRFNKIGDALDVSHVHMTRYMSAADYAIRQVLSVQLERPPTVTERFYARDQRTLTGKFAANIFNTSPDRMTYPVIGSKPQPDVRSSGCGASPRRRMRRPRRVGSAGRWAESSAWV